MPYIKADRRAALENNSLYADPDPQNAGELNYLFTVTALEYIARMGKNYQHINDVVGALEGAKMEFYRRLAAPYEDIKVAENGDVY